MTITTKGSITIGIGQKDNTKFFTLDGVVGNQIQVGWRAKDGDKELPLGSLTDILPSVWTALGGGEEFGRLLNERLDELANITPLEPVVALLRENMIYITDLAFAAECNKDGNYVVSSAAFGFRVAYEPPVDIGPIKLKGFGVLFEYTPTKPAGTQPAVAATGTLSHSLTA